MLAGPCIRSAVSKYQNGTPNGWHKKPSIWERSTSFPLGPSRRGLWERGWGRTGTQYVAMVTELLSSYCGAHLVEYAKNQTFLIQTGRIWLSVWRHHLANSHILKIWISLERKAIFENSKQHLCSHAVYLFMFENGLDWKRSDFRHSTTLN